MNEVSDAMLMAYVDDELDGETAERVRSAANADSDIARRIEDFRRSRAATRDAFAEMLAAPVPGRLVEAIWADSDEKSQTGEGGSVARFPLRANIRRWSALPLAAGLALAVGLGSGLWLGRDTGGQASLLAGAPALAERLAVQPSGSPRALDIDGEEASLAVLGSFRTSAGICRTFRLTRSDIAVRGVGCDQGQGYSIGVLASDGQAGSDFSPASDRATMILDAFLDAMEASQPLNADEEAAVLKR